MLFWPLQVVGGAIKMAADGVGLGVNGSSNSLAPKTVRNGVVSDTFWDNRGQGEPTGVSSIGNH